MLADSFERTRRDHNAPRDTHLSQMLRTMQIRTWFVRERERVPAVKSAGSFMEIQEKLLVQKSYAILKHRDNNVHLNSFASLRQGLSYDGKWSMISTRLINLTKRRLWSGAR